MQYDPTPYSVEYRYPSSKHRGARGRTLLTIEHVLCYSLICTAVMLLPELREATPL